MRSAFPAIIVVLAATVAPARPQPTPSDYPIKAVPLADVHVTNGFWQRRLETNRAVTIPHIMRENKETGRIVNFMKAAGKEPGEYQGQRYNDTDVYKVIEAASDSLVERPDPALEKKLDDLIAIIAAAQQPDGYLYNPRDVDPNNPAPGAGPERWSYLHTSHELYDMGHMIEAAVAHYRATGKRTLFGVAIKAADLICRVFGPDARHDAPGHEEIELALVKLYRVTGDRKYLDQAKFFLDQRGRPHTVPPVQFPQGNRFFMYNDLSYRQDQTPVVDETRAVGHAVRAMYLLSGMTDVAALLGDTAFGHAVDRLWQDVTSKRIYVTGGLGSNYRTEAFGDDYQLPNRAYAETCASVGGLLWYHRMFLREGDASYLDVFERTLYNGYLSGVSLAGDTFFYQNPLESDGTRVRQAYFDVACCPANLARLMAQLPGLVYAQRDREVYVRLFVGSEATLEVGGVKTAIAQQTDYPWSGDVNIRVDPAKPVEFTLAVRIPGWARGQAMPTDLYRFATSPVGAGFSRPDSRPSLTVNGHPLDLGTLTKGFVRITRRWQKGDRVELTLPMPVRQVVANDQVAADRGKAAIERGPVVYAVEAADNGGKVTDLRLSLGASLEAAFKPDLLDGVVEVTAKGEAVGEDGKAEPRTIVAVPYFAWANRGKGQMAVWIQY